MKINSSQPPQPLPESARTGSPSPTSADARATGGGSLGEDSAQLSGVRVQVQTLVAQALQFPEVRQEKVNALRQSVLGGSYQPNSEQIADSLLAHMLVTPAA